MRPTRRERSFRWTADGLNSKGRSNPVRRSVEWKTIAALVITKNDTLDRELNSLVREMEREEADRRAVIDTLVMLGSDEALRFDV